MTIVTNYFTVNVNLKRKRSCWWCFWMAWKLR